MRFETGKNALIKSIFACFFSAYLCGTSAECS